MGSITMDLFSQVLLPLLGTVGGGMAAYAAIRSDLAFLRAQMEAMSKSLERAHSRIDDLNSRK